MKSSTWAKAAISLVAVAGIVAHYWRPELLRVDATTVVLIVLLLLPWSGKLGAILHDTETSDVRAPLTTHIWSPIEYGLVCAFAGLGLLQATGRIQINSIALLLFMIAAVPVLLPLAARYVENFELSKDSFKVALRLLPSYKTGADLPTYEAGEVPQEPEPPQPPLEEVAAEQAAPEGPAPSVKRLARRTVLSDQAIIDEFTRIPEFRGEEITPHVDEIRYYLSRNGITTREQLARLVASEDILDTLRRLYIRVLRRDQKTPIDPIAVAVWGSALFRLGLNEGVARAIELRLRESPEYQGKIARGVIVP